MFFHLQFELSFVGSPQIQRTILLPELITLPQLSQIIPICFGWPQIEHYVFRATQSQKRFQPGDQIYLPHLQQTLPFEETRLIDFFSSYGPFYFQYGTALAAPKILLEIQEDYQCVQRDTMFRLRKGQGNNVPNPNGICTLFSIDAVNQQLEALRSTMPNLPQRFSMQKLEQNPEAFTDMLRTFMEYQGVSLNAEDETSFTELCSMLKIADERYGEEISKHYTMRHCLEHCTKAGLIDIMRAHQLSGYSKLRKAALVDKLEAFLLDDTFLYSFLSSLSYQDLSVLDMLCEHNIPPSEELYTSFNYLLQAGIAYLSDDGISITLPIEVKNKLIALLADDNYQYDLRLFNTCYAYATLAVYLYGLYPLNSLTRRIEEETGLDIGEQELAQALNQTAALRDTYLIQNGYILHPVLQDISDQLALRNAQRGHDFYWPDEAQLNQYYEKQHLANPALYQPLMDEIAKLSSQSKILPTLLIHQVDFLIRSGLTIEDVQHILIRSLGMVPSNASLQRILRILNTISDDTVHWTLCGHTPNQMRKIPPSGHSGKVVSLADRRKQNSQKKKK